MNGPRRSKRTRRRFTGEFKAKVALEAIKAQETINQIAARHEVHPHQVTQWKQQLLRQPVAFDQPAALSQPNGVEEELYAQIGRLKMELEWLKKSWDHICLEQRRAMIAEDDPQLSMRQQCRLLGLHRSGVYYEPVPESAENLQLMQLLDRQYTRHPEQGVRRMTLHLRALGHGVNPKRVRRLLRQMGLEAFYPKPRMNIPDPVAARYPYLLKGSPGRIRSGARTSPMWACRRALPIWWRSWIGTAGTWSRGNCPTRWRAPFA